jgi:uncharacterized alpha/beta hydrolase family protein
MDADQTTIKLDVDKWKIKVRHRRNNRMRLQINLSKDEAEAYKNFAEICKPEDITESDFLKTVFITGVEGLNKQLAEMVQQYAKENQSELAASGITVLEDEDGEIKLASTADLISADVSGPTQMISDGPKSDKPEKYED